MIIRRPWFLGIAASLTLLAMTGASQSADFPGPFFHSGDGTVTFQSRQGGALKTTYRRGGQYDDAALQKINNLFGAPWTVPTERINLRLIELLDHLQDHFGGASILLRSGYRSPTHNERLRALGKLAAQSSLHMEGAAIDCHLQGIASTRVFEYLKGLGCCGVGYYHGQEVHIDVGPPRFWDEVTSGAEDREPQENAKIMLATDRDRYRVGEAANIRFLRITQYPVVVPTALLLEWQPRDESPSATAGERPWKSASVLPTYPMQPRPCATAGPSTACQGGCITFTGRAEAKIGQWMVQLPPGVAGPIRARLGARFCQRVSEKMPATITSNIFEIW